MREVSVVLAIKHAQTFQVQVMLITDTSHLYHG